MPLYWLYNTEFHLDLLKSFIFFFTFLVHFIILMIFSFLLVSDLNNRYELSNSDINNMNTQLMDSDFTIYFQNAEFSCPILLAEFVSPKIASLRKKDPTLLNCTVNMKLTNSSSTLKRFQQLLNGENISFFKENNRTDELITVLLELENDEITKSQPFTYITNENAFFLLTTKKHYNFNYTNEINYFARNFYYLRKSILKLQFEDIENIFKSKSLLLPYEFYLVSLIRDLIHIDKKFIPLIKYINFECLTKTQFDGFMKIIDYLDPKDIKEYWPTIKDNYIKMFSTTISINDKCSTSRYYKMINISYNETRPFNGIFQFLLDFNDGNNITDELVKIEYNPIVTTKLQDYSPINNYGNCTDYYIMFALLKTQLKIDGFEIMGNISHTNIYGYTEWKFYTTDYPEMQGKGFVLRLLKYPIADHIAYIEYHSNAFHTHFILKKYNINYWDPEIYIRRIELYGTLNISSLFDS